MQVNENRGTTAPSLHKAWDWAKNTSDAWLVPSDESWGMLARWKDRGFRDFLDLGCGLGRHTLQFAHGGFETCGLELSPVALDSLRSRLVAPDVPGGVLPVTLVEGDMASLPWPEASFDCLLAWNVISHTDTQGIKKVISEIRRVLRPGGEFFLTLCSKETWGFRESGHPRLDDNTVLKKEDGPENDIPHFYADRDLVMELFRDFKLLNLKHVQEVIVDSKPYVSWHWHVLGEACAVARRQERSGFAGREAGRKSAICCSPWQPGRQPDPGARRPPGQAEA